MVDRHTLVNPVPEGGEQEIHAAHEGVRVIGGDLPGVAASAPRRTLERDALPLRSLLDRRANRRCAHQFSDQGPAVREIGADDGGAHVAEVHSQETREPELRPLGEPSQALAQVDRRTEPDVGVSAIEKDREETAKTAGERPVFGEEHAKPPALPLRCASDEDRDWHQRDIGQHTLRVPFEDQLQSASAGKTGPDGRGAAA